MDSPSTYMTRSQARKIDSLALDQYEIPGLLLMENAGRACADVLCRLGIAGPVVVCCGKGNNGGDGLVLARHLDLRGYPVKVLLWSEPQQLRGDAACQYCILRHTSVPIVVCDAIDASAWLEPHWAGADWLVDALLGTGSQGPPKPPLAGVIRLLNGLPSRKYAIDLPSGLDCDTGAPADPTFRADHTCTFVAPKTGFASPAAGPVLGTVHVVDIGAPRKLITEILGNVPRFAVNSP